MDQEGSVVSGSGSGNRENRLIVAPRSGEASRPTHDSGSGPVTTDEDLAREQRTQIAVQLATLQGKIDTVIARMEAGDRQGEQLVALTKDQIKFLAADTGELKAVVRDLSGRTEHQIASLTGKVETGLSTVRTDLERQVAVVRGELDKQIRDTVTPVDERIKTFGTQMDDLRLWRARVVGMAVGASILSSGITASILKGLGAN